MRCRVIYKPINGNGAIYVTRWFPRIQMCHDDGDLIESRTFEFIAGSEFKYGTPRWLNVHNGLTYRRCYIVKFK